MRSKGLSKSTLLCLKVLLVLALWEVRAHWLQYLLPECLIKRSSEEHTVVLSRSLHKTPPAHMNLHWLTESGQREYLLCGQLAKSSSLLIMNMGPVELRKNMCSWYRLIKCAVQPASYHLRGNKPGEASKCIEHQVAILNIVLPYGRHLALLVADMSLQ